jgi:hypothetical protein
MAYPVTIEWLEHGDRVTVNSSIQFSQVLDRIAAGSDPSCPPLVLIGNEGGILTIGLGAPVSILNHIPPSGDPPYMMSVGDGDAEGVIDFYYFGHHSQFAVRNTIPNELAREAALYYAVSGILSDNVAWE